MIRKLAIMLLSGAICLLGITSALAAKYNETPMSRVKVAAGELREKQKGEKLYVISTGICDYINLFSGPGYPKDIGSHKITSIAAGSSAHILEVSKDGKWYKVRLDNKKEGWIIESCTGTKLQIGGEDTRIFFTVATGTMEKRNGYLKRVRTDGIRSKKIAIIKRNEWIEFVDKQLGTIKLPWMSIHLQANLASTSRRYLKKLVSHRDLKLWLLKQAFGLLLKK